MVFGVFQLRCVYDSLVAFDFPLDSNLLLFRRLNHGLPAKKRRYESNEYERESQRISHLGIPLFKSNELPGKYLKAEWKPFFSKSVCSFKTGPAMNCAV
jgi:hypothetical protein